MTEASAVNPTGNLKVVIDRQKWGSGDKLFSTSVSAIASKLYNPKSGLMCCMGFAAIAAGLTQVDITNIALVSSLNCTIPESLKALVTKDASQKVSTLVARELARENDIEVNLYREANIIALGKDANIDFEFIN